MEDEAVDEGMSSVSIGVLSDSTSDAVIQQESPLSDPWHCKSFGEVAFSLLVEALKLQPLPKDSCSSAPHVVDSEVGSELDSAKVSITALFSEHSTCGKLASEDEVSSVCLSGNGWICDETRGSLEYWLQSEVVVSMLFSASLVSEIQVLAAEFVSTCAAELSPE